MVPINHPSKQPLNRLIASQQPNAIVDYRRRESLGFLLTSVRRLSEDNDMADKTITSANAQANKEKRIDDLEAALEESEEQSEEDQVIEEADANQKSPSAD